MRQKLPALLCALLLSIPILAKAQSGPAGGDGGFAAGRTPPGDMGAGNYSLRGRWLGWGWVTGPTWYWSPFALYSYPGVNPLPYLPPGTRTGAISI